MPIFLFCKQIVDVLYQFKILDYGMVLFAFALICYKVWKDKLYTNIKEFIRPADIIVFLLMLVYVPAFFRYPSAYGTFFKVESCFLIYFLGRVYGEEIMQHGKVLAAAGYLVVYANLVYRFYQFGFKFIVTGPDVKLLTEGALYYYKTDLAIGMIIAALFIYMFSENKWLKWITIVPVCGYMVFYSAARMPQLIMAAEYLLIFLCELEKRTRFELKLNAKFVKITMGIVFFVMAAFFVVLQLFPFEQVAAGMQMDVGLGSVIENLMHSRHIVWWDILQYFSEQSFLTRLFGIDLGTEYMHNAQNIRAHSMYIKQIYATGYIGCFLLGALVATILVQLTGRNHRKLMYTVLILGVMLFGAGLTIESLEATQMSWFPMLFTGILITGQRDKNPKEIVQEQQE